MVSSHEPVVDALGHAHAALLHDLHELEEAARPGASTGRAELGNRLGAVYWQMIEHFRFEEENGYMDAVRKREPRLERAVQQLAEEHRQLKQDIEALLSQVPGQGGFGEQVRTWIGQVRAHEIRENRLVQEAFDLDLGAED
jgi:hypothetical protein